MAKTQVSLAFRAVTVTDVRKTKTQSETRPATLRTTLTQIPLGSAQSQTRQAPTRLDQPARRRWRWWTGYRIRCGQNGCSECGLCRFPIGRKIDIDVETDVGRLGAGLTRADDQWHTLRSGFIRIHNAYHRARNAHAQRSTNTSLGFAR